jgi:23S rRNA (uracil1939-C5)-methyltransferase
LKKNIYVGKIVEANFPNKNKVQIEDNVINVKGGILGQTVEVKRSRGKKGKILNVVKKSDLETLPGCIHTECGGCAYDTLTYEDEVKYKEDMLKKLFKENGFDFDFNLIPNSHYTSYRNKMEYTFGDEYKGSPIALGLHKKNKFYEIENTTDCQIVHEDFNKIRYFTRDYFEDEAFYNRRTHEGTMRHLVIRRTNYGEILINLVTVKDHGLDLEGYVDGLLKLDLEAKIVGITHTSNDSLSDAIINEGFEILYGRDYCVEELLGLKFKIGAFSFFQTNSYSAETLYKIAQEFIGDIENKNILDLYSGTGTITQIMAQKAKKAVGIEIVESAVKDAFENAKLNAIENVDFIASDVLKALDDLKFEAEVIVLDPPREGVNPKALKKILERHPQEILYISCNPVTFTEDLEKILEEGYKVLKITGLDQFPRTNHVEAAILMTYCGLDKE